jgi:HAD superfamily hydrolase (TIGR01509 family)
VNRRWSSGAAEAAARFIDRSSDWSSRVLEIRALIFDFDGLILDTETPEYEVWRAIYAEHDQELALATWATCIGTADVTFDPYADLEARLGRPLDRAAIRSSRRSRTAAIIDALPPLPGVVDYLDTARSLDLRVAVASSSTRAWVVGHLTRLGLLDRFSIIRTSDDVVRTKPDPALYLAALEGLGLASTEAIVLEDSPNGVLAAKRAGLYCVAVPNTLTANLPLDHADRRLRSMADLSLTQLLADIAQERAGARTV